MPEIVANLHMHTRYSDGSGSHTDLAQSAIRAGVDVLLVTDHNVWVNGVEDYYHDPDGERRVLLLVGEEIHDRTRIPQKNHLLVWGAERELSPFAAEPQRLLDSVNQAGGLAFIAHPIDPEAPSVKETDISWEDWSVSGYTGIELWNGFSEFKTRLKTMIHALYYAFDFDRVARGPLPQTLQIWDRLLAEKRRVVAVGGSDAHALHRRLGVLRRVVFPYEAHFRAVNTHLQIAQPLSGDVLEDRRLVYDALRQGHAFIGYDRPAPTRGFQFIAQGIEKTVGMGDEIPARGGVTLQIRLPQRAECRLLQDGALLKTWRKTENCTYITTEPGVYRVEVYLPFKGERRGWIFSNPIYVR
jgi:hypothetical protein